MIKNLPFLAISQTAKKTQPNLKTTKSNSDPVVFEQPSAFDPPSEPGDPPPCATCEDQPSFISFPNLNWTGLKKNFFVCDPRFKMGLGTQNPVARIEIKGNFDDDVYTRGLRLTYKNGLECHSLMFEYGQDNDSYIGSLSAIDFHLRTANHPRLSIASTGEVAINSQDYRGAFTVNGTTLLGDPNNTHALTLTGNNVLITDKLSINTAVQESSLNIGGNASIGYVEAAPTNGLLVQGSVGIGTTSPQAPLHVNGEIMANGLKLSGLNGGLLASNGQGTLGMATAQQLKTLFTTTSTEGFLPVFGGNDKLEDSYIRQALLPYGSRSIAFKHDENPLKAHFHFGSLQTLHVDDGTSIFGFNTYSNNTGTGWTYPKLDGNLGASQMIQENDGRISFRNLKINENEATDWKTALTIDPNRNVGIGTENPISRLQVNGDFRIGEVTNTLNAGDQSKLYFSGGKALSTTYNSDNQDPLYMERFNELPEKTVLRINLGDDGAAEADKAEFGFYHHSTFDWTQAVAIYSNGELYARKVKVTLDNYPDYVFKPDYKLRTLDETEAFINAYHHLPEMPSAVEIEKNGADLGELHKAMLKQLEELTLQVIALKKEVETMKASR